MTLHHTEERQAVRSPLRFVSIYGGVECGARARSIVADVAGRHGLTFANLIARGRCRKVVRARQEAMWALRHQPKLYSYPAIGRLFKRDHSTIIHGVAKHAERMGRLD